MVETLSQLEVEKVDKTMNDVFFTSDEHYGHENMLKFCNRPFVSLDEQMKRMIERHNDKVSRGARVYHLGDIFWRTLPVEVAFDIMSQLKGQHFFIYGNHDELMEGDPRLRSRFVWCKNLAEVKPFLAFPKIVLCHYAMRVWNGSHKGSWHLYGHSHAQLPEPESLSFDCGVDGHNYEPWSIEEVAVKMHHKISLGHGDPLADKIKAQVWPKREELLV